VSDALKGLVKMARKKGFSSIALPRLATGVGGLKWEDVQPIVQNRLGQLDIPVYVYVEYHAGQQADER
jgi:O-acetyl-ADP-ribose deacetylase (regulator of RNase III)